MASNNIHADAIADFYQEQRQIEASLDKAIEQSQCESRQQEDEMLDWALRHLKANPIFDDEWTI